MTLYISNLAQQKLSIAANMKPQDEISGFGKVELVSGGALLTDIVLPPQEVGGAHITIKADDWQAFLADVITGKYSEDGSPGNPMDWRCWWHKHPGSGKPGPSSTDTDSLSWLAADCGFGWMVGVIISSRAEETYAWLDVAQPNSPWLLTQRDVSVKPYMAPVSPEVVATIEAQMEHVKAKVYTPSTPTHQYPYGPNRGNQPPLLPAGRSTDRTSPRTPTSMTGRSTGSDTDWTLVKGIRKVDGDRLEITYRNGNVLLIPDKGQQEEWVAWLSTPAGQGQKPAATPPPVKKPGERAPKKVKKAINRNISKFDIQPLLEKETGNPFQWSPGATSDKDAPRYDMGVDMDNLIVLGFDDEGDPICDLSDGDEYWVYYDIHGRAIDRSALDPTVRTLKNEEAVIAYYRSKYLLAPDVEDEDVMEYVKTMFDDIEAIDLLADEGEADLPMTVDESKVGA